MTALPTEPGSVIGWHKDGFVIAAVLDGYDGSWWLSGDDVAYTAEWLASTLAGTAWWYLGRVTPDGITTTR
jgi:hypothetical protein